jgi:Uma2 family endonuclease
VFEILSPEDTLQRLKRKLDDYTAMRIPQIWVIDPQDGSCYRYQNRQLLLDEQFSLPSQNIEFPMSRIAELLD